MSEATEGESIKDPQGNIFLSYPTQHVIRRKEGAFGTVSVYAGIKDTPGLRDGAPLQALFNGPIGMAIGPDGRLWVGDRNNQAVRRVGGQNVTTIVTASDALAATGLSKFGVHGVAFFSDGTLVITDDLNYVVWSFNTTTRALRILAGKPGVTGTQDGQGQQVRFQSPGAGSPSSNGQIINILDVDRVRQITRDGSVKTLRKQMV